jgi:spore maturation protein CgeB
MKILLVGEYAWPWYHEACAKALESLGCRVVRFGWLDRFMNWRPGHSVPVYKSLAHRLQFRFLDGPLVRSVNRDLVRVAVREKPDVVWFYNVTLIHAATVRRLREGLPDAVFCESTNDNPFSPGARRSLWRHYVAGIPSFDLHYVFRERNIADLAARGVKGAQLLRGYFIPEDGVPMDRETIEPRYQCDVVFAGHYEDDGRVGALEAVCRAGYRFNLFGGGWEAALPRLAADSPLRAQFPVRPVTGVDYNYAISGAKVALAFFSGLNQDTYTTRSFQIPAMRVAMLSQRTDDMASLFVEGEEVACFSSTAEMLEKVRDLVTDATLRERVASAGYDRVYRDGHDVRSRMQQWLDTVHRYIRERPTLPPTGS